MSSSPTESPSPKSRVKEDHDTYHRDDDAADALTDVLNCVLRFGASMLRAGTAAFRVREAMGAIARALRVEAIAVHITLDGMTATARRGTARVTLANEIGSLGVNAWRIGELERLARSAETGVSLRSVAAEIDAIEAECLLRSSSQMVAGVGAISGAFSYLNGGGPYVILASAICGALGHAVRMTLLRRRLNQYAVTALCAVVASGAYCLMASATSRAGLPVLHNAAGFVSSVLFLVPGFPMVAALLDLMQHQTLAGISRITNGVMLLAAATAGFSLIAAVAGLPAQMPSAPPLGEVAILLLRALASAVGACGFAILFNSSSRALWAIAGFAAIGNELRLTLHDAGVSLTFAAFIGALTVGLLASQVRRRLHESRIALTVPGIIMMLPGRDAFQAVVSFCQGDALAGLRSAVFGGFVVGALAAGLVAAHFVTERDWLVEP